MVTQSYSSSSRSLSSVLSLTLFSSHSILVFKFSFNFFLVSYFTLKVPSIQERKLYVLKINTCPTGHRIQIVLMVRNYKTSTPFVTSTDLVSKYINLMLPFFYFYGKITLSFSFFLLLGGLNNKPSLSLLLHSSLDMFGDKMSMLAQSLWLFS